MKKNKIKLIRFIKSFFVIMLAMTVLAVSYNLSVPDEAGSTVYTLSKLGSRGEEVRKIQTKLRSLGYYKAQLMGFTEPRQETLSRLFKKTAELPLTA